MTAVVCVLLVVFLKSLLIGGVMEAIIRCDNEAYIYIDGIRDGLTDDWEEVWRRNISGKTRLVAVRCYNIEFSGGLIASFANGKVSDESWKCRYDTSNDRWYRLDTDDRTWDSAYGIPRSLVPPYWITSSTFPDNAKWIWKDSNFNSGGATSFCRAELGVSMYIKVDNQGLVYADGVEMSRTVSISNTKIIIPRTTQVVAIRGNNWKNTAFIQAIFPNGHRTDTSWRCTDKFYSGWNSEEYDDSHWDQATDYGPGDIGNDVRKIWTADIVDDSYIYCRGHFECGCEYMCKEHDNEYDFHCLCPDGFTLAKNELSCDEDVCGIHNSGCEDICVKSGQSYTCECSVRGYEIDIDKHSCINIDECKRNENNCSQVCEDTEGAFKCDCRNGYTLQQDGASCNDVNECDHSNGNCDHLCMNKLGSYNCGCTFGYELNSDGHTCSDINECDRGTHNCSNTMVCENTEGGFTCVCPVGYELGKDMMTCRDIDECEIQDHPCDHTCINTVGSYMCNCSDSYSLADDGHACLLNAPDETKDSNTGLVAGIVTTLLVVVIVGLLVGAFVWKRRRRSREENDPDKAADQRGEPSYENIPNQERTGVARELANSIRQTQESTPGNEVETSAGRAHYSPRVYYNVGRVGNGDETSYDDVSELHNGALGDISQPPEPAAQAQTRVYASLNRQLEENDERSPYTELA